MRPRRWWLPGMMEEGEKNEIQGGMGWGRGGRGDIQVK